MIDIRALTAADCTQALALYALLNTGRPARQDQDAEAQFEEVITHPGTEVLGVFDGEMLVAMVTLHVLPNMTNGGRPYALIENVVTHQAVRKQGLGRMAMQAAIDRACLADAYKVMLLTGKANGARRFYEKLGFSADEKWGMVWRAED